jgi:LemA protein
MISAFRKKKAMHENELKDLLDMEVVSKKKYLVKTGEFLRRYYKHTIIALFVAFCIIRNIYYFNTLTIMRQQVTNIHAQIESALQMRQNLIPALTIVVYQFINHEKNVFLKAVEARENSLSGGRDTKELLNSLKQLTGMDVSSNDLARFMAVAENYPQLVSNQSYQLLIGRITDVENQIYQKRIEYNDTVNNYNTRLSTFPVNVIGRCMGFYLKPYFKWENKAEWLFVTSPEEGELPVNMVSESRE